VEFSEFTDIVINCWAYISIFAQPIYHSLVH